MLALEAGVDRGEVDGHVHLHHPGLDLDGPVLGRGGVGLGQLLEVTSYVC